MKPVIYELSLPPDHLRILKRLTRSAGDDPRDGEIAALRQSNDQLANEVSELRVLCEIHGIETDE